MTDVLSSRGLSANSDRSQTFQTQKPIKTLTTSVVNDDEKYESDHGTTDKVQVQKSSLPADDSKDTEVESEREYGLEPATEQEEPSYSASQQTKQADSIDYVADVYPSFYSQEMESALANVRKLASIHQEQLANSFLDTFASYNGREASLNDLSAIFGRIEVQLAEEAADDLSELDDSPYDDEEGDADFDEYNVSDRVQVEKDLDEDYLPVYDDLDDSVSSSDDLDDGDYDPKNFEDLHQGQKDLEEDMFDSEEPLLIDDTFREEVDEDDIIDGINFDTQYFEAIEVAQSLGHRDAEKIVDSIMSEYSAEYGAEALEDIISKSFSHLASYELDGDDTEEEETEDDGVEQEEEEEESKASELVSDSGAEEQAYVDPDTFSSEMDLALANVRKLASFQQEEFIVKISDLYSLYNGSEPSVYDLADIFSGIKQEFADEAAEEILSELDADIASAEEQKDDGGDSDSDYDPKDESDLKQVEADEAEDYSSDEDVDENAVIS